jgi:hypothetical protein
MLKRVCEAIRESGEKVKKNKATEIEMNVNFFFLQFVELQIKGEVVT